MQNYKRDHNNMCASVSKAVCWLQCALQLIRFTYAKEAKILFSDCVKLTALLLQDPISLHAESRQGPSSMIALSNNAVC